jgi:adenylate cyclase
MRFVVSRRGAARFVVLMRDEPTGARAIAAFGRLRERMPGLLREAGLSALQVWSSISEKQGRGRGNKRLAVVFTDLAGFSDWTLKAGDDEAVRLLRDVDCAMEPAMREHGGEVVKRMGDGMMAVFDDSREALEALQDARERLAEVEADGYKPRFRAGIHVGKPRRLGGDYFGVDVNIAARLAEQASPDEVLVSDAALAGLEAESLKVKKKRRFKVKGVPDDLQAYSITPR